jgi:murein L,D-transpeptidase YcbB/YkuD
MERREARRASWSIALVAVAIVLGGACGREGDAASARNDEASRGWAPAQAGTIVGVSSDDIRQAIQRRLHGSRPTELPAGRWLHVQRLYGSYNDAALWMETEGPNKPRTNALLRAIVNANDDALRLDAYPLPELVQAMGAVRDTKTPTAEQLADADVLLTTTYVSLAEDLLGGQTDPKQLSQDWHISGRVERVDSAVARSLRAPKLDDAIARMRPQYDDYAALQKSLARFRSIVINGGWQTVPRGKLLKRGDHDSAARLSALRARLAAEGFAADSADSTARSAATLYDRSLAGAVADFQAHHGIVVDSILGDSTVQSLNLPARYRLAQIAANLERLRWLPRDPGQRYIIVNVSAFHLEAYDSGQKALEMKVIVGEEFEGKQTPVFADSMQTVVFRPYWQITPNIQAKEIEPKIAADPGYLERNDMEYYKDGGQTRIRQRPGDKNSLGLVKFLFPNDFNIYLHGTPEGQLFDKDVRAFSHGCIRLEKPEELASWVLGWPLDRVMESEHGENNRSFRVPSKLPVYITYLTTYTRDGDLYFGNDLYGRDDKLVQEIASGSFASPEAAQNLDKLRKLVNE